MYNNKRVLLIAGSDSSGGAGLEADQKVLATNGCYAMTATTALTAQNTLGVTDIHIIPSDFVAKQIDLCISDVGVDVVKTGMLASASTVQVVAQSLKKNPEIFAIIDPVMVATSGARLLPEDAIQTLIDDLLPLTELLTPNIPEAALILSQAARVHNPLKNVDDLKHMAQALSELGPKYVLVKGGHSPMSASALSSGEAGDSDSKTIVNVLYSARDKSHHVFISPHLSSKNTHGTGCSLASAIAANILNAAIPTDISSRDRENGTAPPRSGLPSPLPLSLMEPAISNSLAYITHSISTAQPLGQGSGPINHFSLLRTLPFVPGHFIPYLLGHASVRPEWRRFTHHAFVQQLASGSLPMRCFKHYMTQDYLYLRHFARAHSLAGYKATSLAQIAASAAIVLHIKSETALHVRECAELGLTLDDMEGADEDVATTAYSRFLLDTGLAGDWFGLQVALLPCLLGYGVIAERLDAELRARDGGTNDRSATSAAADAGAGEGEAQEVKDVPAYRRWIANYVADDFQQAVRIGSELIEDHAAKQSPERVAELVGIFLHATKMESAFWDMGLNAGES